MKNRYKFLFLILIILMMVTILSACAASRPREYNVDYIVNGGTVVESRITSIIEEEPTTTREGYAFAGWYLREDFSLKAIFPMNVTREIKLYAKWELTFNIVYTTCIVDDTGYQSNYVERFKDEYIPGSEVIPRGEYEEVGYEFLGWQNEIPQIMPEKQVTILGFLKPKKYNICFNVDENVTLSGTTGEYRTVFNKVMTTFKSITVTFGQDYTAYLGQVIANKPDYDFDCWTYTNDEYVREEFIPKGKWDIPKNLLLTPKWVQLGTAGLIYTETSDKKGYSVSYQARNTSRIIVPSYNPDDPSKPIISIAEEGFLGANISEIVLPSTLTSIGARAFMNCVNLTSVNIPQGTKLGTAVFRNCTSLQSIIIPRTLDEIPDFTFAMCTNLESVTIEGTALKSIGNYAFSNAKSLTRIKVPTSLIRLGNFAFENCEKLEAVTDFSKTSVETIGVEAFSGCLVLTAIELPQTVTTISQGAFKGCILLRSINIPQSVRIIESAAFENCESLMSVVLHMNITTLKARAFYGCIRLDFLRVQKSANDPYPNGWEQDWDKKSEDEWFSIMLV